jgi:hypothetical protein
MTAVIWMPWWMHFLCSDAVIAKYQLDGYNDQNDSNFDASDAER